MRIFRIFIRIFRIFIRIFRIFIRIFRIFIRIFRIFIKNIYNVIKIFRIFIENIYNCQTIFRVFFGPKTHRPSKTTQLLINYNPNMLDGWLSRVRSLVGSLIYYGT